MKVRPICKPCLLEQCERTLDIMQIQGPDRSSNLASMEKFINERLNEDRITAELGTEVHRELKRLTLPDPYAREKKRSNDAAKKLEAHARSIIRDAEDPLKQAFKVAIAGNLIDFGTYDFDIDSKAGELKSALSDDFAVDEFDRIRKIIEGAGRALYLCDNAGEIVFDRLCIEEIQKIGPEVTAVVKSGPIVNDATIADAEDTGLTGVCRVIESGTDCVGVILEESSQEFLNELKSADLIIAKGQGHYETMDEMDFPVAFLLKAKCGAVSSDIRVSPMESVVKLSRFCSSQDR